MIRIKRILLCVVIVLSTVFIVSYAMFLNRNNQVLSQRHLVIRDGNLYTKNYNYLKLQQVSDYEPHNYSDLLNIFYSILNQGWTTFTFYCPNTYNDCIEDVNSISNDEDLVNNINNYVHPFNSYSSIRWCSIYC